ncbi:MAG: transcriptional regulator [Deltaproteobacteria bacterium]|nr:transcriptional regulator [Deltaproteobacteria bacterium]
MAILGLLRRRGSPVDFTTLREDLGLSGGNLLSHLRALEQSGVIASQREAPLGRTRTLYRLTDDGLRRVVSHARALKDIAATLEGAPDAPDLFPASKGAGEDSPRP